jgi:hypothetical protein
LHSPIAFENAVNDMGGHMKKVLTELAMERCPSIKELQRRLFSHFLSASFSVLKMSLFAVDT